MYVAGCTRHVHAWLSYCTPLAMMFLRVQVLGSERVPYAYVTGMCHTRGQQLLLSVMGNSPLHHDGCYAEGLAPRPLACRLAMRPPPPHGTPRTQGACCRESAHGAVLCTSSWME